MVLVGKLDILVNMICKISLSPNIYNNLYYYFFCYKQEQDNTLSYQKEPSRGRKEKAFPSC